jgi:shikimate kinase
MRIFLIGFMGAGKTTAGKLLAEALSLPFTDTDEEIVKSAGMPVSRIFETYGEARFREMEKETINAVPARAVVSCGGGLPCYNDMMTVLLEKGNVIWLKASLAELKARLAGDQSSRPLLTDDPGASAAKLLSSREPVYSRADHTVLTDNKLPEEVAEEIAAIFTKDR